MNLIYKDVALILLALSNLAFAPSSFYRCIFMITLTGCCIWLLADISHLAQKRNINKKNH